MIYDWYRNIEFAHPQFFALLLILPIMILWYVTGNNKQQGALIVSSTGPFGRADSWKTFLRHTPFVLRVFGLTALIIALARPQTRNDEQIVTGQGIDIILCMDVSGSMLAQDFLPNRLEAMKQVAVEFVEKRPTDRIGLVVFAGESFTVCPITTDRNMLKSHILGAQSSFLADGTAIGDGLSTSVERLRGSKAKSRVIILLTDGENQGGLIDPLTAKEIAKSDGVKVYTVGMGTEGYASAPMQNETGQVTIQRQKVNIDEPLLRQIAGETGGLYFRARDNTSLQNIYTEIDKLEKTKVDISVLKRYTEQFLPFAIAAAIFILLELVLRYTIFKKFP